VGRWGIFWEKSLKKKVGEIRIRLDGERWGVGNDVDKSVFQ
jgi:hypothetical protein